MRTNANEILSRLFEVSRNETDRGYVLLAASAIEAILRMRIGRYLGKDEKAAETIGELAGSFSYAIDVARRLELIDRETGKDLHLLRQIRNGCAHGLEQYSLETSRESLERFKCAQGVVGYDEPLAIGDLFLGCVTMLSVQIHGDYQTSGPGGPVHDKGAL